MGKLYECIQESVHYINSRVTIRPRVGVVLGSGWWDFVQELADVVSIEFSAIPHLLPPWATDRKGALVLGKLSDIEVACLKGRLHTYEGFSAQEVAYPVRVLCGMGIGLLYVTNAAGGIGSSLSVGDLMLVSDHINMTGGNPLRGEEDPRVGPRFLDMTDTYDPTIIEMVKVAAHRLGIKVKKGIYVGVDGPSYETPAEIKLLRSFGADAVGMSTIPEVIAARQMGVRVCGLSCITNMAAGLSPRRLTHEEVLSTMDKASGQAFRLLKEMIIAGSRLLKEGAGVSRHG